MREFKDSNKFFIETNHILNNPIYVNRASHLESELISVYSSKSFKLTKPFRDFAKFVRRIVIILGLNLWKIELKSISHQVSRYLRFFYKAYFTSDGKRARKVMIQFTFPNHFSYAQRSVSDSKFIIKPNQKKSINQVNLVITQDLAFDPYLIFRFCLLFVKLSNNSTIYCDFKEPDKQNPFIKGRWDFVYNRSISLLNPMYMESLFSCSLAPVKIENGLVFIRSVTEYSNPLSRPLKNLSPRVKKVKSVGVSVIIPTANRIIDVTNENRWLINDVIREISKEKRINFQFVVIHNGNMSVRQKNALRSYGDVEFVHFRESKFNISKKINMGVKFAKYDNLLLANDDISSFSNGWVYKLLEWLDKSYVGIVVPRIHYENGLLQYAGIELDIKLGLPSILGYRTSVNNQGYGFTFDVPRQLDAATGVLMATRRSVFNLVGGWDEKLAVNYNDIDFSLRVREKGLSIIYEPNSRIFHLESASRDVNMSDKIDFRILARKLSHYTLESYWPNLASYHETNSPTLGFNWYFGSILNEINFSAQK